MFALDESRPPVFLAGLRTTWTSEMRDGEVTADLFGLVATTPNAEVDAVHPKAIPVILATVEEVDRWMTAPAPTALALQRPLPEVALRIVARGTKKDETVIGRQEKGCQPKRVQTAIRVVLLR